ncbi:2-oxoglutarate-dependent dioxygenase 19-like [Syzygium oleosum]|uniref:2-oxoglutarate-dependent dioxygenase 19-like n=1 Tax=Syzygium oleosum TaxID=219896 RepID=UPI0024B8A4DA|nr:2-oxoglutarate-dependent dioxygenase 19-like [Syzygium oleosum]
MKATVEALMGFFDLTEEEKSEFEGKHVLDPIRYGTSFKASVDKVFLWRDFLKMTVHPKFHCPTKPEGLSKVLAKYSGALRKLVRELLKGISEGLGLKPGYIDEAMNMDSSLQILATNLMELAALKFIMTGSGSVSPENAPAVKYNSPKVVLRFLMVKADLIPNAFVVNTVDQLEIVSNGKYKSVLHRAIVNNKAARLSIPFSTRPSPDTVVVPAKQLVDGEHNQATYISMNYKDYLEFKQSKVIDGKSYLNQVKI